MHPNPAFRFSGDDRTIGFARDRSFGVLAVASEGAPLLSHIPFVLAKDGKHADLHLVRSNPILRVLDRPVPARIAVSGPDSYVSPDWYGMEEQVPTWNYVAVHLTGQLEKRPMHELRDVLDRLSALFEDRLLPKPPWVADKMEAHALERMMRMVVPCRLDIKHIDGTWKLSQNKPDAARLGAAAHMEREGIGLETRALSQLMREE